MKQRPTVPSRADLGTNESNVQHSLSRITARIDRLPVWGLRRGFFIALGLSYLLALYDVTAIGVNMEPMLTDLQLPAAASGPPITGNLIAYMLGSYLFGSLADLRGRRVVLRASVAVLAAGSLLTALSWNLTTLTVFRSVTGVGIGAQIAIAATLISEFSPAAKRGRYLAVNVMWGALGYVITAFLGIAFDGMPHLGWRLLFALPAVGILLLAFLTDRWLPESPRWLALHGRWAEADTIVLRMEEGAQRRTGHPLPPVPVTESVPLPPVRFPTAQLLTGPLRNRLIWIFTFWFVFYLWVYGFLGYETTLLSEIGASHSDGLLATALGNLGFLVGAVLSPLLIDRVERKFLVLGGVLTCAAGLACLAGLPAQWSILGVVLVSIGDFIALPSAFSYTSEMFPTSARGSAMAIGDGLGHLGGAAAPLLILPFLTEVGARGAFWSLAVTAVLSGVIITFGARTTHRPLTESAT